MATSTISITPKLEQLNNIYVCRLGNMGIISGTFVGNGTNSVLLSSNISGSNSPCLVRDNTTGDMAICYIGNGSVSAYKSTLPNQKFTNEVVYDIIGVLR